MKTLIAIPCMDTVPVGFAQSLLYLEKGENVNVLFKPSSLIYDSRNLISLTAIEKGFDRVMWFDSDMLFDRDTMTRLHADMDEYHADMVTGLYFKRKPDSVPVIYDRLEPPGPDPSGRVVSRLHEYVSYPQNSVFPVSGCGFGCVMTSVKLLKDVWDRFGPAFLPFPWAGEDISFCYRVNQIGYRIYCDSRVSCGHVGTFVYSEDYYKLTKRGEQIETTADSR